MKSLSKKVIGILLSAVLVFGITGCSFDNGDDGMEAIDPTRTQLFVFSYDGGYGSDWLVAAKKRYEQLHAEDVYEEGKKGIQIYINPKKEGFSTVSDNILLNRDEIYFHEYAYYKTLKSQGMLADITEAVTGDKADLGAYGDPAGTTIESKLTEQQKAYYGIEENGETHYYGLPHYSGYMGIVYNRDLFDRKGYYFREGYENYDELEDRFILQSKGATKSKGPDGKTGIIDGVDYSLDDGLPVTYDDFFELIHCIYSGGDTPISWLGADYNSYLQNFMCSLVADYEGLDQMSLNFNFHGEATDLGTVQGGQFVKDEEATEITPENGYELARQRGKYEALKFINRLVTKSNDQYHNNLAFNGAYSHMDAQDDFLYAGNDGGRTNNRAMLIDGVWWENEASDTFDNMVAQYGETMSKDNRNFCYMPLPKATEEKAAEAAASDKAMTLYDHIFSICFVKANIAEWKKPIALDFIKFVHTDESLVEFTVHTNTPKAFNYEIGEADLAKLTTFGRSVIELKNRSNIVYPYSSEPLYVLNQSTFGFAEQWRYSSTKQFVPIAMRDDGITAEAYFSQLYTYTQTKWNGLNK